MKTFETLQTILNPNLSHKFKQQIKDLKSSYIFVVAHNCIENLENIKTASFCYINNNILANEGAPTQ